MDIVGSRIAVDDLDRLAGHAAEQVRMVPAAALIERGGFLRDVEGAAAEAFFYKQKTACEMAAAGDHGFGRVRAFAGGILAHVDLLGSRRGPFKFDGAADGGSRRGIDRRGGSSCRGGGRRRAPRFLLLSASPQRGAVAPRGGLELVPRVLLYF